MFTKVTSHESSFMFATNPPTPQPNLRHLANRIIVSGEPSAIPSVCGANCSCIATFDGPYFVCNASTANATFSLQQDPPGPPFIYNGSYKPVPYFGYNDSVTYDDFIASYLFTSLSPTAMGGDDILIATQQNLTCLPYRAQYILNNRYNNSIQNLSVSATALQPLVFDLDVVSGLIIQNLTLAYISYQRI